MGKKDEFSDLRAQIQNLKRERENKQFGEKNDAQDQVLIERVKSTIDPILKAFVKADRFLEVQSSVQDFYITYANAKICRISVSAASPDNIDVELTADSVPSHIYSGSFNDKEIKNVVKNELINWYRSLT